jgi:hypothetical protein
MPYAQNVLGWAAAYATGVVPVDLPAITGPPPPLGSAHDEHPEGLGPGLPMNINGLSINDPMARTPLIDLSGPQPAGAPPMFPWMTPATPPSTPGRGPGCTLICISSQTPPADAAAPPWAPQPLAPPPWAPPPPMPPPAMPPPAPVAPPPPDPAAAPPAAPAPSPAAGAPQASPAPKPANPAAVNHSPAPVPAG